MIRPILHDSLHLKYKLDIRHSGLYGRLGAFGGRTAGDVSHALMCMAISACRAFRNASCRITPGGRILACSCKRLASSARWSSRDRVCSLWRCFMITMRCSILSMRSPRRRSPLDNAAPAAIRPKNNGTRMGGTATRADRVFVCPDVLTALLWREHNLSVAGRCQARTVIKPPDSLSVTMSSEIARKRTVVCVGAGLKPVGQCS